MEKTYDINVVLSKYKGLTRADLKYNIEYAKDCEELADYYNNSFYADEMETDSIQLYRKASEVYKALSESDSDYLYDYVRVILKYARLMEAWSHWNSESVELYNEVIDIYKVWAKEDIKYNLEIVRIMVRLAHASDSFDKELEVFPIALEMCKEGEHQEAQRLEYLKVEREIYKKMLSIYSWKKNEDDDTKIALTEREIQAVEEKISKCEENDKCN